MKLDEMVGYIGEGEYAILNPYGEDFHFEIMEVTEIKALGRAWFPRESEQYKAGHTEVFGEFVQLFLEEAGHWKVTEIANRYK